MTSAGSTTSAAASSQLPLPTLRPVRLDDYPEIERLESSHGLLTLAAEDWRRMWLDNPLRRRLGENWPIGWVLEDAAHRIVGSLANIPTLYTYCGRELVAATGRAWVVLPEYRGVALWLMDEYFNQDGVDLFVNTTVNELAVEAFSAFGSMRVPLGNWQTAAFWITNYRGFASTALKLKQVPLPGLLKFPAAAALKLKDTVSPRSLPATGSSAEITQTGAFDARFDAFWNELLRQNPKKLLCVRDGETLSWHFAGSIRARQLWIATASRNGLLRAYCIFKRHDHPPSGLIRMRLVDYQTLDPKEDYLPGLLHTALARCANEGIYILEHVGGDLPKMRTFDRFAPYRRTLPSWPFYYHATDVALNTELRDPSMWDASSYDGDSSL